MATLDDVLALARKMNVSEEDLINDARRFRYGVESLGQFDADVCDGVITSMKFLAYLREDDPTATLADCCEDEEDDFDLERQMDKWEVQYLKDLEESRAEEAAMAEKYRDYCELKYGWDCS